MRYPTLFVCACVIIVAHQSPFAQTSGRGSIHGHIRDEQGAALPGVTVTVASGEAPGASVAVTDAQGFYRLTDLSAGPYTVVAELEGFASIEERVAVRAGGDVELDLTMAVAALEETVTVRAGNAEAIMEQRNSMNITNTIGSDAFGDVVEGNVGEFLKDLPGVDVDLTQGEVRNVRLRGLGPEYTSVTVDGVSLASADANRGTAGDARAFSFEQASLSSVEAIEVLKTVSADVDANAPAGTINLRSKAAFRRAGRSLTVQTNFTAFRDEFRFGKSMGPDDTSHHKIRPGAMLEYGDVFFDRRLGVVLSLMESNLYSENARASVTYDYDATETDPRPVVPTAISFLHAPRINRKSTVSLKNDFRATPDLALSLGLMYNYAILNNPQRSVAFNAGSREGVVGEAPLTRFVSPATGAVTSNNNAVVKPGQTFTVLPRLDYRRGNWMIEGRFAASDSKSWYNPLARNGSINSAGVPRLADITFEAERSSPIRGDWQVTQVAGPDLSNAAAYDMPPIRVDDGRSARTQVYSADVAATLETERVLPVTWKAGVKMKRENRDFGNDQQAKVYEYTGPGAGTGGWADYTSPFVFDVDATNASITSPSGQPVFLPDAMAMGRLFQERPGDFTRMLTANNYYSAFVANTRHYEEDIAAGFAMGTASLGRAMVRAGLRWEETRTDALEFDPLPAAAVRAAGFPVEDGRATTIPGLDYQYFSSPQIHRTGRYDNFFPSAAFKYQLSENLDVHVGYSSTIRRPTIRDVAGVWAINDDALTVNAPNANLEPETSDNFAARLAYYLEPVGVVAANVYQNNVQGLHRQTEQTAAEFGYDGNLDLSGYTFISTVASNDEVVIRGVELQYSQGLMFLPAPFKGLNVSANYTHNYAREIIPRMAPHAVSASVKYSHRRFDVYTNARWRDDTPLNIEGTRFRRRHTMVDVGGGLRLTDRLSLLVEGRNITSEPVIFAERIGVNPTVAYQYELTGAIWTFGLKGVF